MKVSQSRWSFSILADHSAFWQPIGRTSYETHLTEKLIKADFFVSVDVKGVKYHLALSLDQSLIDLTKQFNKAVKVKRPNHLVIRLSVQVIEVKYLFFFEVLDHTLVNLGQISLFFLILIKLFIGFK